MLRQMKNVESVLPPRSCADLVVIMIGIEIHVYSNVMKLPHYYILVYNPFQHDKSESMDLLPVCRKRSLAVVLFRDNFNSRTVSHWPRGVAE